MPPTPRQPVVGINSYHKLDDLSGPENDARDFVGWLCNPTGGDVPPENIIKLIGSELGRYRRDGSGRIENFP